MKLEDISHGYLVERACKWLRNTRGCSVVLAEPMCQVIRQQPDAIGFTPRGWSIAVECKMSLRDYRSDFQKAWRQVELGVGQEKWYFAPQGLIDPDSLPDNCGLIELAPAKNGGVPRIARKVERPWVWCNDTLRGELPLLVKAAREGFEIASMPGYRNSLARGMG